MIGLDLKGLMAFAREQAKDVATPQLWSDATLIALLNEGQWEACRRARLLKDTTTDEVCRIDLDTTTATYDVDPRVIFIRRVKLSTMTKPLGFKRVRDMDEELPGWEGHTGQVTHWIPDYTTGKLRLYRFPDATAVPDFAMLTVVRGPMNDMVEPDDPPEIHPRFHLKLPSWALYRMLSRQDAETYDPKAAADNLAAFEAEFGKPSPAIEETWLEEDIEFASDSGVF